MAHAPTAVQSRTTSTRAKKNNNKKFGLAKERERKKYLEERGWEVTPSKGSFGTFDLVAMNEYGIRLIQVKSTRQKKKPSYGTDIKKIRAFTNCPPNSSKELHVWWNKQWKIELL